VAITVQHSEESLCLAHIYAVAGMAGLDHAIRDVHDYGVDGQFEEIVIHGKHRTNSGHPLAFQAKATVKWESVEENIVYDLEAAAYNNMVRRTSSAVTLMLILLCLPRDRTLWHTAYHDGTVLRNCCYWHILRGDPCTNTSTKRVFIPNTQLLTADTLTELVVAERLRRA
jgi:hypothetical protein